MQQIVVYISSVINKLPRGVLSLEPMEVCWLSWEPPPFPVPIKTSTSSTLNAFPRPNSFRLLPVGGSQFQPRRGEGEGDSGFHGSTVPQFHGRYPFQPLWLPPKKPRFRDFLAGHWVVEVQSRALNIFVDRVDPADHGKHVFFRDEKLEVLQKENLDDFGRVCWKIHQLHFFFVWEKTPFF